jgi:hypothetical protein
MTMVGVASSIALAILVSPSIALGAARSKTACGSAYELAQELRRDGKLKAAREKLLLCAQRTCPRFVEKDCAAWLTEVEASLPSIVIAARDDAGRDLIAVRVIADGEEIVSKLDGRPITIDPGLHRFRYELASGEAIEDEVAIREGEKDRRLTAVFPAEGPAASSNAVAAVRAEAARTPGREIDRGDGISALTVVSAGVAVVAIGSFAFFGLDARSKKSDLEMTCAPACRPSQVDPVRRRALFADVSLILALAAIAVTVWSFLDQGSAEANGP